MLLLFCFLFVLSVVILQATKENTSFFLNLLPSLKKQRLLLFFCTHIRCIGQQEIVLF